MSTNKTTSWYADIYTKRFGFHLIPLKPNSKLPLENDWGNNCVSEPESAAAMWSDRPELNMGLELGRSRMCSLDIDCLESFKLIMADFGIDQQELDTMPTIQGKGLRVMFRLPDDMRLPYCKLNWPSKNDPTGDKHRAAMRIANELKLAGDKQREARVRKVARRWAAYTVVEFRSSCDGRQRFDVLPPSIHPDTKQPYKWVVQPKQDWPCPPKWLLTIWREWERFKPQLMDACPWKPKPELPQPKRQTNKSGDMPDVQGQYNQANPIESTLVKYGYTKKGSRYLSPHSSTGLAGVHLLDSTKCFIHHASDPLCSEETGQPVSSFDLYCYYDCGGDRSEAFKRAAKELGIELKRPAREVPPMPTQQSAPVEQAQQEQPEQEQQSDQFKCLGFDSGNLYVLPARTEQVVRISINSMRKNTLMQLAPLEWWEAHFPTKNGVDWDLAYSTIIRWNEAKGVYNPNRQRGRGAWYDEGKPVLHLGDSLLVEGCKSSISNHNSRYIYTRQASIANTWDAKPASVSDGQALVELFHKVNWEKVEHSIFALGWVALAPICGALSWRPHLWITAQRGSGKSWLQESIIDKLVGEIMVYCQGGTTEAGIRQRIKQDARPVMFDEAESENSQAMSRIQSVIELARQSSTDSGAEIMKGTVAGDGMSFRMRSMFLMGSINVGLRQAADESRFTVVSLKKPSKTPESIRKFRELENDVATLLTDEFCSSIRNRVYGMIPIIRKNAKTLATAVGVKLGSQRIGDQVGALLAGYASLICDTELTQTDAELIVDELDLDEATEAEEVSDELNCYNRIMQHQVRIDGQSATVTRSLGELVAIATVGGDGVLSKTDALEALPRFGLVVHGSKLRVANSHTEIEKALRNSPWETGWRRILVRLNGSIAGKSPAKFAGSTSRFVEIPL